MTIKNQTNLGFFLSPDGARDAVLLRNYGAITAAILDDGDLGPNSVIRLQEAQIHQFVDPYCEGCTDPLLLDQYNEILVFLNENNLTVLGPLTSTRAAIYMKEKNILAGPAIELAVQRGIELTEQQGKRVQIALDAGKAMGS